MWGIWTALQALEIRLAVVLHNTHANIDQLARHKAMLLAQKKTSPVFKAQKLPKAQVWRGLQTGSCTRQVRVRRGTRY